MDLHENVVLRFAGYIANSHVTRGTFDDVSKVLVDKLPDFPNPKMVMRIYHCIASRLEQQVMVTFFLEIDLEPTMVRLSFDDGTVFRFSYTGELPDYRFQKFIISR